MKGIIKKIALILAGIAAISAVSFGVVKLVEFVGQDLKTISLSFEVGNLGTDGKYVNDETTLYTKDAFQCDGLQIKLDFDNAIDYRIYYYNDLDTFIESTDVITGAYSGGNHDSYARVVIIPTDDEDEKISFMEKFTYAGQMTVKVSKVQDAKYVDIFNKRLRIVDNKSSLRFVYGDVGIINGNYQFILDDTRMTSVTSKDVLQVKGGYTVSCSYISDINRGDLNVIELKENEGNLIVLGRTSVDYGSSVVLSKDTKYVLIVFSLWNEGTAYEISTSLLNEIPTYISITK